MPAETEGTEGADRSSGQAGVPPAPPLEALHSTGDGSGRILVRFPPARGGSALRLHELWSYRELLYFLVWRDLKVRYKQAALGAGWVLLQPLLAVTLFSVVFGRLAGISSGNVPYPLFFYAAFLPWQLFAYSLAQSGNSLVSNERLITKVYFPRLLLPVGAIIAGFVDFAIGFLLLLGLMLYYGTVPTAAVFALPLFLLLAVGTALAVGIWLSALNVAYRDVQHALPFLTQIWFFATPIAYPSTLIPDSWRIVVGLNPMAGVVEGFRWTLFQEGHFEPLVLVSALVVAVLLLSGIVYFRRVETTFADVI